MVSTRAMARQEPTVSDDGPTHISGLKQKPARRRPASASAPKALPPTKPSIDEGPSDPIPRSTRGQQASGQIEASKQTRRTVSNPTVKEPIRINATRTRNTQVPAAVRPERPTRGVKGAPSQAIQPKQPARRLIVALPTKKRSITPVHESEDELCGPTTPFRRGRTCDSEDVDIMSVIRVSTDGPGLPTRPRINRSPVKSSSPDKTSSKPTALAGANVHGNIAHVFHPVPTEDGELQSIATHLPDSDHEDMSEDEITSSEHDEDEEEPGLSPYRDENLDSSMLSSPCLLSDAHELSPAMPSHCSSPRGDLHNINEPATPSTRNIARGADFKTPYMRSALEQFSKDMPRHIEPIVQATSTIRTSALGCINPVILSGDQHGKSPEKTGLTLPSTPLEGPSIIEGTPVMSRTPLNISHPSPYPESAPPARLSMLIDTERFEHDHNLSPTKFRSHSPRESPSLGDATTPSAESVEQTRDNLASPMPHYASSTIAFDARRKSVPAMFNTPTSITCHRLAKSAMKPIDCGSSAARQSMSSSDGPTSMNESPSKASVCRSHAHLVKHGDQNQYGHSSRKMTPPVNSTVQSSARTPRRSPIKASKYTPGGYAFTPHPSRPLRAVVALVEVFTLDGNNASSSFIASLCRLGAQTTETWSDSVTHVVFKAGSKQTLDNLRQVNTAAQEHGHGQQVFGVNSRWVTDCDRQNRRVSESAPEYALDGRDEHHHGQSDADSQRTQTHTMASALQSVAPNSASRPDRTSLASSIWDESPVKSDKIDTTAAASDTDISWSDMSTPAPAPMQASSTVAAPSRASAARRVPAGIAQSDVKDLAQTMPNNKVRKLVFEEPGAQTSRRLTNWDLSG